MAVVRFELIFFKINLLFKLKDIALQNFAVFRQNQHESAIGTHMSSTSWTSFPSPSSSHPVGCYRAPVWVPWVIQQIPIGCVFYIW